MKNFKLISLAIILNFILVSCSSDSKIEQLASDLKSLNTKIDQLNTDLNSIRSDVQKIKSDTTRAVVIPQQKNNIETKNTSSKINPVDNKTTINN